jgi:hypothetical protein
VDVRYLHTEGLLKAGHWFSLRWSRAGRETGSIRAAVIGGDKPERVIMTYRHRSGLVHIQDRCRVRRSSENHETSHLRPFTFGHRKRALGNRATLQSRFRHAPSPDHPRQSQERTRLDNSPLIGVRLPDGARRHPPLQREGPCCSGGQILATQAHPRRLRGGECRGFEREMLHRSPREFGYHSSLWTLEMAAQVAFEEGLTQRRVSGRPSGRLWHACSECAGSGPNAGSPLPILCTNEKRTARPTDESSAGQS